MIFRVEFKNHKTGEWSVLGIFGEKYLAESSMRQMERDFPETEYRVEESAMTEELWRVQCRDKRKPDAKWEDHRAYADQDKAKERVKLVTRLNPGLEFRVVHDASKFAG